MSNTRIYVIEGIPGSGKKFMKDRLLEQLQPDKRPVYYFEEESGLASWIHYYLPDISLIRLTLMESMLQFMSETLQSDPDSIFVITRFHISWALTNRASGLDERYLTLVNRLKQLPVTILFPVLKQAEVGKRVVHAADRKEEAWRRFLKRRAAESNFRSLADLYTTQQRQIVDLLQTQGIPFIPVRVDPDTETYQEVNLHDYSL
jgi:hypothetical protein